MRQAISGKVEAARRSPRSSRRPTAAFPEPSNARTNPPATRATNGYIISSGTVRNALREQSRAQKGTVPAGKDPIRNLSKLPLDPTGCHAGTSYWKSRTTLLPSARIGRNIISKAAAPWWISEVNDVQAGVYAGTYRIPPLCLTELDSVRESCHVTHIRAYLSGPPTPSSRKEVNVPLVGSFTTRAAFLGKG